MTDDRVCVRWKSGICRFTCFIPSFLLTALHISFLLSASAAVLVWSLDQPSRSQTERKNQTSLNAVRGCIIFGLEHQQFAFPTCGTVLSHFILFLKREKLRRSSRPGRLLWENDLRDDCFAPISPLESCWVIIGESL